MLSFKSQDNFHFLLNVLSCFPDIFLSCRNSNPIVLTLRCTNIYEWVIEWINIFQSSCAGSHGHDLIVLDETRPLSCLLKNPNISAVKNPSNQNASSLTLLVRQLPVRTHKDLIFFSYFFPPEEFVFIFLPAVDYLVRSIGTSVGTCFYCSMKQQRIAPFSVL